METVKKKIPDFVAGKLDKHRQVDSGAKRIQEALVEKEKQRKKEE